MTQPKHKREKMKGRREAGNFVMVPHAILDSARYIALSAKAKCLLVDVVRQFNGKNNGSLGLPWSQMNKRGWRSKETFWNAIEELEAFGFLLKTRQGHLHRCNLYAFTWKPIDDCPQKDIRGTRLAPGGWQGPVPCELARRPQKRARGPSSGEIAAASTEIGTHRYDCRDTKRTNGSG